MALRPDGIEERLRAASQHVSGGRVRRRLKKKVFSDGRTGWDGECRPARWEGKEKAAAYREVGAAASPLCSCMGGEGFEFRQYDVIYTHTKL